MKRVRLAPKGKFDARKGVCKVRTKAKIVLKRENPVFSKKDASLIGNLLRNLKEERPEYDFRAIPDKVSIARIETRPMRAKKMRGKYVLSDWYFIGYADDLARSMPNLRIENPRVRVRATPTEHEKNEWARMAQDAYAKGFNAIGHRFSAAAALPRGEKIPTARFDSLMADYRAWLIDGWKAFAEENPRGRSKRGITRVSQATGARPSKRLIERRKKTLKAPKGYFANPKLRKGQVFVVTNKAGDWLAEFGHRDDAVRWAKAYANRHGVQVRVVEA